MKIYIHIIGKIKEPWINQGINQYLSRMKGSCTLEFVCHKSVDKLSAALSEKKYICLDENSKPYSSVEFSSKLMHWLEKLGSRVDFVIGEHTGLDPMIKSQSIANISLSPMTFTYQMATLIFVEQCYRAIQIHLGTGYHKA